MTKPNESETAGALRDFFQKWKIPQPVLAQVSGIPPGSLSHKLNEKILYRHLSVEDEAKLKSALSELRAEIDSLLK